MDREVLIHSLETDEIDILLRLYYNKEGVVDTFLDSEKEILERLSDKNLVSTMLVSGENIVSLTDEGLNICGSMMFNKVQENITLFKERIQVLPERAVTCLVNRILWKDSSEKKIIDAFSKQYISDENLLFEQVLLTDERMKLILGGFYTILESIGFVKTVEGEWLCSPEVEDFLKQECKDKADLNWNEEDSLKYYFFFYAYAQDQKNLIRFTEEGDVLRSTVFGGKLSTSDYWYSSNQLDPHKLLSNLGISEERVIGFLKEMQRKGIVSERYYPLSSFTFFSEEDKMFVIDNIKAYMSFITNQFLTPVVDSLVEYL